MISSMKKIDIFNEEKPWKGKKHYLWFKEYDIPYYGVTSKIDITIAYNYIKSHNLPVYLTILYLVNEALSSVEEFRLREIDGEVYLIDHISPSFLIMKDNLVYDNCNVEYSDNFNEFLKNALEEVDKCKKGLNDNQPYNQRRYDQFYYTVIPWINYTSISHPMPLYKNDTTPRIVWDKFNKTDNRIEINLSLQVNHAFVDGFPLSLAFIRIQENFNNIENILK